MSDDPQYQSYLRSPQWRAKRSRIIADRGGLCEVCGARDVVFHLHHLTYVRLYDEMDRDLLVVCEQCHAGVEDKWHIVRGIGAKKEEQRVRQAIARWQSTPRAPLVATPQSEVEAREWRWNGEPPAPFVPMPRKGSRRVSPDIPTASIKDREHELPKNRRETTRRVPLPDTPPTETPRDPLAGYDPFTPTTNLEWTRGT